MNASFSKSSLREDYQNKLSSLDFFSLIEKSARLSDGFFSWSKENASVLQHRYVVSFCPFGNEPQLNIEVEGGHEAYRVSYVRVHDWKAGRMEAHVARRDLPDLWEETNLQDGNKFFQPYASQPTCKPEDIAVILVPGLAFTKDGYRLGRGAGFYDRFLERMPHALRIGIAFTEQLAPTLPIDAWDLPVDALLTDSGMSFMNSYLEWPKHGKLRSKGSP